MCLITSKVHAQEAAAPQTTGGLRIYADDDHVTVVSPSASASFRLGESLGVDLGSTVDAVTAASVDVITQASPGTVHEIRVEGSAALLYPLSSTLRLKGTGIFSHENDYDSARAGVGAQMEVAERNTTLDLMYTFAYDDVGSSIDETFTASRRGHILAGGVTQILDARTYLDVLVDLRHFAGYHASPYRRVPMINASTTELMSAAEQTPEARDSAAASLRIRRALGDASRWFVHASYRLYGDDWRIVSHTLEVQLFRALAHQRFLLGLKVRGYSQGAADFYQAYYHVAADGALPTYRTRDRILGGMASMHAGITLDAALGRQLSTPGWRVQTMLSGTHFRYDDFPAQRQRNALVLAVSLLAPL